MATIRQRRSGVWEVRGYTGKDDRGRPTQMSRTVYGTKRDAERVAAEFTVKPARNAGGRQVAQLLDEWIEVRAAEWAPLTLEGHRSRANLIAQDPIGRMSVASVGPSDIDRWVAQMRGRGVGEGSIRNRHGTLRTALSQAVRWEWISTNPAQRAPVKQPSRIHRSAISNEEVRAVLRAAADINEFAGLALRLAAETGARRAELAALRWVSLDGDRLVIDRQVVEVRDANGRKTPTVTPTKTANQRQVTLSAPTLEVFQAMRSEWGHLTTWVFGPDPKPVNPSRISWWWARARKMAGIDPIWRLHDLRHWSATNAIASGSDVRTVANRLGHADPSMTLRVYAHAVEAADRSVAAHLGAALEGLEEEPGRKR